MVQLPPILLLGMSQEAAARVARAVELAVAVLVLVVAVLVLAVVLVVGQAGHP